MENAHFEDHDAEVSAAFSSGRVAAVVGTNVKTGTPQYTIIDMDRSDDEESDHTPDPYTQHMRGRVSPSPYTANTERARQFNAYVRGVIEQKLDVLVPISHQPRDLITEIITDASTRFPEFASCVRKRIRTYLKSYRRSKRMREVVTGPLNGVGGSGKVEENVAMSVLPSALPSSLPQQNEVLQPNQPVSTAVGTAVVTIIADPPQQTSEDQPPETKRIKLAPSTPIGRGIPTPSSGQSLSGSEVTAVRQLITGYRESAAFLQRAADQLEAMLAKDSQ